MSSLTSTALVNVLNRFCPEIEIDRAELNQEGQYNDILMVNNELIFRFPTFAEGVARLKREAAILSRLQEQVTLAVPNPIFLHEQTEAVGEAFMGYRLLPGRPLWQEEFRAIHDSTALERIAHQLAGFLRELHTIPVATFQGIDLPVTDQMQEWT
jgi:aminoglycoside 2''-phosphotransferase